MLASGEFSISGGEGRVCSSSGELSINICGGGGKSPKEDADGEARPSGGGGRGGDGERRSWGLKLSWLLLITVGGGAVLSRCSDIEGGGGGKAGEGDRTGWLDRGGDEISVWT